MESAKGSITPVASTGGKRGSTNTWQQSFVDSNEQTLALVRQRLDDEREDRRKRLKLDEDRNLLDAFKAGLITKEEYRERTGIGSKPTRTPRTPRVSPRASPRRPRSGRHAPVSPAKSISSLASRCGRSFSSSGGLHDRDESPDWHVDGDGLFPPPEFGTPA
ncbi:unnamed protein product [Peniophora sp. CBMAI 1063]|nr:unnamed protein product [Peniophora sp. CBMAI 1063]